MKSFLIFISLYLVALFAITFIEDNSLIDESAQHIFYGKALQAKCAQELIHNHSLQKEVEEWNQKLKEFQNVKYKKIHQDAMNAKPISCIRSNSNEKTIETQIAAI